MLSFNATKIRDWSEEYYNFLSANRNKSKAVNRWFPILEGFSNSFVESLIQEFYSNHSHIVCLDPFAGGGTTPLVAQELNIQCYGFEVSPFMSQVCRAKLRNNYLSEEYLVIIDKIKALLEEGIKHDFSIGLKTIKRKKQLRKWLFHKTAFDSLLNIRKAIDIAVQEQTKYKDILYVALGSMLLQFSNVNRDGKALKYKENWQKKIHRKKTIYEIFISKCSSTVFSDIAQIEVAAPKAKYNNIDFLVNGDCRKMIDNIPDVILDLVVTSPPYLNSRDYTDSHMIELWMLGHVTNYEEVRELRRKTMRSHVQVKWGEYVLPNSEILKHRLEKILTYKEKFWNRNIPSMIVGYFCDMEELLYKLKSKMKPQGKLFINVANSAYFGVVIETDRIIEEIANNLGYKVLDIRLARKIKTSSQQYGKVRWLRETVIILESN